MTVTTSRPRTGDRSCAGGGWKPDPNPDRPSSATLRRVVDGGLCSGCGACAAIAPDRISMRLTGPGLLRPVQHDHLDAAAEERIAQACPGHGLSLEPAGRAMHPLWGPVVSLRTGHASDPALRRQASSGGALSAVLVHLVERQVVDAVVHTAAAPDLPIGNATVVSTSAQEIFDAAGSRYAPSAPLAGLERHLADGRRFAFVGKPCDVAALRAMAAHDPRIGERFPVLLSFFCAGVPSLRGSRTILRRLGVREADLAAFRYRGDGWPGYARATMNDGSSRQMTYAESWGGILSREIQLRCKICPDGTGAFADIVCADAWQTDERGYPVFNEAEGESLVVARTRKGEAILADAIREGAIVTASARAADIGPMQPGQVRKRRFTLARLLAMRACGRATPAYRGFQLSANARAGGLKANAREFAATVRRIVLGRL